MTEAIPPGMKLVPIEPTEEMRTAWMRYIYAPFNVRYRAMTDAAAPPASRPDEDAMDAAQANGRAWAVAQWMAQVSQRPLVNVHRRTLDDVWRQVIRYFGGDPVKLLGPAHDDLWALGQTF